MRLSIAFSGFGGIAETIDVVEAAEDCGLDGVWTSEHIGFHDAVVPSSVYLSKTKRMEIGLVGLSTAGRHPGLTAMELMSLSELAPGRIRCQVGLGSEKMTATIGRKLSKPVASTTAFVNSLREAMQGRDMTVCFPEFAFNGFRMSPLGPVPAIDVMAIRPKMVQLSARVGDGLSISAGASIPYIRDTVKDVTFELAAAGRDRRSFRITAFAIAVIGKDLDTLRMPLVSMMSNFPQDLAAFLARGVVNEDEVVRIQREKGSAGLMEVWTPEKIDQIALIATPAMLADKLAEYGGTGIDELALIVMNPIDQHKDVIEQLAAARGK